MSLSAAAALDGRLIDPSRTIGLLVPARNAAAHLPRLFDSVDRQTRPFDEIHVYDDASNDDTGCVALARGATVFRSEINTGGSAGKNVLAERATSSWLHFHDADDALHPEFVERAHRWIDCDEADVVLFGTQDRSDVTGSVLLERRWSDDLLRADAVRYCIVNTVTNCGIYRRSAFLAAGGFDVSDNTRYNEDQAMHLRLALAGLRFRADDYLAAILYQRPNSMSSGHRIECARAHYHVLAHAAEQTGHRYARELGAELWKLAGVCGTYRDWDYVRRILALATCLGQDDPAGTNRLFRALARLHPVGAVVLREQYIRWFKPDLRTNAPTVS